MQTEFDKYGVSFVSVTQEINTSTSSGRMMLNVLMAFAQFEREQIAERIRDKLSASKMKGKYVDGLLPLGYRGDSENMRMLVDSEEATDALRSLGEGGQTTSFQYQTPAFSLPGNFMDFMKSPKRIPEKSNLLRPVEPF